MSDIEGNGFSFRFTTCTLDCGPVPLAAEPEQPPPAPTPAQAPRPDNHPYRRLAAGRIPGLSRTARSNGELLIASL